MWLICHAAAGLGLIWLVLVNPTVNLHSTYPTVVMAANFACHMVTTLVFFDQDLAIRAFMSAIRKSPLLLQVLLCLHTAFPLMPCHLTAKAKIPSALVALCLFLPGFPLNNRFTTRLRTESLVLRICNFIIFKKFFEFRESIFT